MKIITSEKFIKEFKKLRKKYFSLDEDFTRLCNVIADDPTGKEKKHSIILKQKGDKYILKVRMMCRAVKGTSFRVIYYYDGEKIEVVFLEVYFKGGKGVEDGGRIEGFWEERVDLE